MRRVQLIFGSSARHLLPVYRKVVLDDTVALELRKQHCREASKSSDWN